MIDTHCHLEQPDYNLDREQVIEKCKRQLKAVITCCAHPKDFDLTMKLVDQHKRFVFATASIHPLYIKEISEKEIDRFIDLIKRNKDKLVGIGEQGLDYFMIKESEWQRKQRELFIRLINFAKDLKKPIVVHARDAFDDAVEILEREGAEAVQMHMFGARHLLKRIIENGWYVSLNTIVLKSKSYKKIARDCPLNRLLLETDSPWLGLDGRRNNPTAVRVVAETIAEIKKTAFEEVERTTTQNAIDFFSLKV